MNAPVSARPLVFGHRGCRGLRPENTLPAFLHALEWPIDGLELDVVISADNQVVVSHEPWLNALFCTDPAGQPLTPAEGRAFNLFQHDYATIRRCNCGAFGHPGFPEQQVQPAFKPLLTDVFTAVRQRCTELQRPLPAFAIELKSTPGADGIHQPAPSDFVALVADCLALIPLADAEKERILWMSFDHRVVAAARQSTPYRVCLLIEDTLPLDQHLQQLGFLPDVIGPDYQLLQPAFLDRCKALQLPIITWTINDPTTMQHVAALGVHGITTDYPDRTTVVFDLSIHP